jgi:putative ABC transport system permease protein
MRTFPHLLGDVRFALRYFARHKATTAIILVVIALGTGANTLIFSIFQAQFLRPAPAVPNDHSHVRIWAQERATRTSPWDRRGFTASEWTAIAEHREIFRDVAAWTEDEVVLGVGDSSAARRVEADFVSPNFFGALGVRLSAGQGLLQNDDSSPNLSAVISYAIATRTYGDPREALGRRIVVNEVPLHVVGVAPPHFQRAMRGMDEPVLWIPLSARSNIARISPRWLIDDPSLSLFGRLAPGASREQATAFVRRVVANSLPDSAARVGMTRTADVVSLQALPPGNDSKNLVLAFTLVLAIGGLILLIAWMNVSSLMVAAAVGRRHEIAVRVSLGASRSRLLRQLVTESTLLALVGSAVGLTGAWWTLTAMMRSSIDAVDLSPDIGTLIFVVAMALGTGILFGLSPALHAIRGGVAGALRDSGTGTRSRSRLQRGFVVAQIALSQPLLVLLGTMLSLVTSEYQPLSPETSRHVIAAQFLPLAHTGGSAQRSEAVDSLIPRIAERAEVRNAVPDASGFDIRGLVAPDRNARTAPSDSAPTIVHLEGSAPGWFSVFDIPIVLGRDVSYADTAAANYPVVIGSDLARKLWGDASPIGRTLASAPLRSLKQDSIALMVVGVYDAARNIPGMTWGGATARSDTPARMYTARGKHWLHDRILVRTRGPSAPFVPELQRLVRERAPSLPVASMLTLAQTDAKNYEDALRTAGLIGAGGALALLVACIGLYGVVALAVRQRTREIGIRIAVGAQPMGVARMFLVSGLRVSVVALAIGLPLSVIALKIGLAQGLVVAPQVNPYAIGGAIALALLGVAAAATWIPARRAATVDPARTLRVE